MARGVGYIQNEIMKQALKVSDIYGGMKLKASDINKRVKPIVWPEHFHSCGGAYSPFRWQRGSGYVKTNESYPYDYWQHTAKLQSIRVRLSNAFAGLAKRGYMQKHEYEKPYLGSKMQNEYTLTEAGKQYAKTLIH